MGVYLTDQQYEEVFGLVPRICVDFAIKGKGGTLVTLRKIEPYKGMWHLPGGRIQKDEKVEDAVKRISLNELGVELTGGKLAGVCEFFDEKGFIHTISIVYMFEQEIPNHQYERHSPMNTVKEHQKWIR